MALQRENDQKSAILHSILLTLGNAFKPFEIPPV